MLDSPSAAAATLHAGDLEIIWSRLLSFMDEAATTMIRTAYSTTIREQRDLTVVLFDRDGQAVAECAASNPSFIGTLPLTMAAFLKTYSRAVWREGDLVITNDPWIGSGHLQDITMATPIFMDGELLGFAAMAAHGPDIGGALYSALSREVFEEGLRIPICRYARAGKRSEILSKLIEANVRVPLKVIGDLEGMAACVEAVARQIRLLVKSIGTDTYRTALSEIILRSEVALRNAINEAPAGNYTSTLTTSGIEGEITIDCSIQVGDGRIAVDYSGTSSAQRYGINVPLCYTYAHTVYPLKCLFAPRIPTNAGTLSPLQVHAPEGSVLNPSHPAPVAARHLTGQYLSAAVLLAMSECLPSRVIAESGVTRPQLVFSGINNRNERFVEHIFMVSGMGGRPDSDGPNVICYPANSTCAPVEIIESLTPLVVERKEIISNSGGDGQWRGGCGERLVIRNASNRPIQVSVLAEMTHRGARGLFGGRDGTPCQITIEGKTIPDKTKVDLAPGARLCVESAGGGGFGPPSKRSKYAQERDLAEGYVTKLRRLPN